MYWDEDQSWPYLQVETSTRPQTLYRVYDQASMSTYVQGVGFQAPSRTPFKPFGSYREQVNAKQIVDEHLDWQSRVPSPLISTYSNLEQAQKRARMHSGWRRSGGSSAIAVIDVSRMGGPSAPIYEMRELIDVLGIDRSTKRVWHGETEWVCWGSIPERAITGFQRFENGELVQRQNQVYQQQQLLQWYRKQEQERLEEEDLRLQKLTQEWQAQERERRLERLRREKEMVRRQTQERAWMQEQQRARIQARTSRVQEQEQEQGLSGIFKAIWRLFGF